jgi:replicative DNA helicase
MFAADVVELASAENPPDLIILDHLHHFFLGSGNENELLKACIHQIKRLKDDLGSTVVVLAQLRKGDAGPKDKKTLPNLEDIRGTASLTDIATDVVIISPVPKEKQEELPQSISHPMYFHLAKSRTASEARNYVGVVGFDFKNGRYNQKYIVCKYSNWEDPSIEPEIPIWARRATRTASKINYARPPIKQYRDRD